MDSFKTNLLACKLLCDHSVFGRFNIELKILCLKSVKAMLCEIEREMKKERQILTQSIETSNRLWAYSCATFATGVG